MKFITKQLYEKIQISNLLVFPKNEEDLNDFIQQYSLIDKDYLIIFKKKFEQIKPIVLRNIPDWLCEHINDGSLISMITIPNKELLGKIYSWRNSVDLEFMESLQKSLKHYKSIKHSLSENIRNIFENYNLHASKIINVDTSNENLFILELECTKCYKNKETLKLVFEGIKNTNIIKNVTGYYWMFCEIDVNSEGDCDFSLLVIDDFLYGELNELNIIFKDIRVEAI